MLNVSSFRPVAALDAIGVKYPGAWKMVDQFRAGRGKDLPDWPSWCFLPLSGPAAIISHGISEQGLGFDCISDISRLGALATWRVTKGIYRFDRDALAAVSQTDFQGDLPCDIFYQLPEWCIYCETPGLTWFEQKLFGFWVHLESDIKTGRHELRILADLEGPSVPIILHLGNWSLVEAIDRSCSESVKNGFSFGALRTKSVAKMASEAKPILSLVLYLCSQAGEIQNNGRRPATPKTTVVSGMPRMFQAEKVTTWDVGVRIGAALRTAQTVSTMVGEEHHSSPRTHIRRAHWHGFRSGPMKDEFGVTIEASRRKFELKWMYPILVNEIEISAEPLPATIRSVE